ncbi:acyl-CoA dehydrogenase family protein [Mycolicibacterium sp. P9-22]|uniref:acyl-CoA dehydrogenase family protein n=1 Tax=Mycolicibacterium sp. P9-22 TaxID=2024613 RepID=UPI001883EE79|nr:acyl-CoA dehydrogenase family protein [Mycolicibacterium sp. P9-22]
MELNYDPPAQEFRRELRELIAASVPENWNGSGQLDPAARAEFLSGWRATLHTHRLLAPGWPTEYGGGGRRLIEQSIVAEELIRAGLPQAPLPNDACGFTLLGPTVLHCGSAEQKLRFLPPTIDGTIRWAQGYSEPEAGSDLFNVRTRAALDGDEWIINGQKVWQTAGLSANWIFILARTDPAASRSRGLSLLLVPIDQPGIEVRGIRNMAGETEFAEFFFTDAVAEARNVVGGIGEGAKVALTLLGFERAAGGVAAALAAKIELRRLVDLVHATRGGRVGDDLRQRLAACRVSVQVLHCLALRTLTVAANGRPPGPESSVIKLLSSEHRQRVTELALDILGAQALTPSGAEAVNPLGPQPLGMDPLSSAAWVTDFLHARPATVYGGSSEIQRNTIGEQILNLPREPRLSESAT